jgi:hypothetical protein
MGRQDDEAKQDSSQGKGHVFLPASGQDAPKQYMHNVLAGSVTATEN